MIHDPWYSQGFSRHEIHFRNIGRGQWVKDYIMYMLLFISLTLYNTTRTGARFTDDFLPAISNSMKTSPCCNSVAGHQIATNFCTCHDSTAVVPCTKFCSDHCIRIEMRVKRNFHRIWIAMEKALVKWGPGQLQCNPTLHHIWVTSSTITCWT